jgi:hypothetical protein
LPLSIIVKTVKGNTVVARMYLMCSVIRV